MKQYITQQKSHQSNTGLAFCGIWSKSSPLLTKSKQKLNADFEEDKYERYNIIQSDNRIRPRPIDKDWKVHSAKRFKLRQLAGMSSIYQIRSSIDH